MVDLWVFNHYASPPDAGAGTRHYDLASEMAADGIRTTIFAAGFSHFSGRDRLCGRGLSRRKRYGAVDFVWVRTLSYRGNTWRRLANMVSYALSVTVVQMRYRRPAFVIGSSVHPFAALAGWAVALIRRADFLYEIRDLWPQTLIDIGVLSERSLQARMLRWIESLLVRRASHVITVLPGAREYLAGRGLPTGHVVYIPNGYRPAGVSEAQELPEHVVGVFERWHAERLFVVVYAGSHGLVNRLDVILEAAEILQARGAAVHIAFVGDGPEKPTLEAQSQALALHNVTFFDPIPKAAVQSLLSYANGTVFHLAAADVFRYGISSNKLFDYLACGKPVVFACESPTNPVAEAAAGRWVAPENPEALATALQDLAAADEQTRADMGRRGQEYMAQFHDVRALAKRLSSILIESSASGKPSERPEHPAPTNP